MTMLDPSVFRGTLAERIRAQGEARGEAKSIIRRLERKGIELSAAERARITTCTDVDQLDAWSDRAYTASTAADVFEER